MKLFTFLAEGFEEIEALTVVDLVRRAGMDAVMVSVTDTKEVKGSHGITVAADAIIADINMEEGDMLFLPGGMPGTLNLQKCQTLMDHILSHHQQGKRLAAICAAPSVYGKLGLLKGRKATCFPGFEQELQGAEVVSDVVVTDGNITTGRGMGTAIDLGLEIVRLYQGDEAADELGVQIQYYM